MAAWNPRKAAIGDAQRRPEAGGGHQEIPILHRFSELCSIFAQEKMRSAPERFLKRIRRTMDFIRIFLANIAAGIRRNPWVLLALPLLLLFPQVLLAVLAIVAVPLFIVLLLWISIFHRVRRAESEFYDTVRNGETDGAFRRGDSRSRSAEEGRITVTETEQQRKRVSDDVGEYIDFKEVKETTDDRKYD